MSIKTLQLCLVLVPTFTEFVEFSLLSAIVKIAVTNKTLVEGNISTVTFCFARKIVFDLKMPLDYDVRIL